MKAAILLFFRGAFWSAVEMLAEAWRWLTENPWRWSLVIIAALALLWWRADGRADKLAAALKDERAAHAITRASVAGLKLAVANQNADVERRAQEYQGARQQGAQAQERAARDFAPTQRRIDAVRAAVGSSEGFCATPDDVKEALR